jgi:MraZ protein
MDGATDYKFWGEFEHAVDDKGRVIFPQDFRAPLGDEFMVCRGPDKAILVYPKPIWDSIEKEIESPVLHRETSFLQRMYGSRTLVRLDPQYRLGIPKHLREHAGITQSQSAVIVGQGAKLEIWSKSGWDEFCANFTSDNLYKAAETVGLSEVRPS